MKNLSMPLITILFASIPLLSHAESHRLSYSEFEALMIQTSEDVRQAHDTSAYCGFYAFSDEQGVTLIVNASDQRTATVIIPKATVLNLSSHVDAQQASTVKTVSFTDQSVIFGSVKVIRAKSTNYEFIGIMLSNKKSTVNCGVISNKI